MGRGLIVALAVVAVAAIAFFFFRGAPEDGADAVTGSGVENAADAASGVAEQAADAATSAADAAAGAAESVADGAASAVGDLLDGAGLGDLSEAFAGLDLAGFDASLLDPSNFDPEALMSALGTAGLGEETATSLQNALTTALDNPDLLSDLLGRIREALGL